MFVLLGDRCGHPHEFFVPRFKVELHEFGKEGGGFPPPTGEGPSLGGEDLIHEDLVPVGGEGPDEAVPFFSSELNHTPEREGCGESPGELTSSCEVALVILRGSPGKEIVPALVVELGLDCFEQFPSGLGPFRGEDGEDIGNIVTDLWVTHFQS